MPGSMGKAGGYLKREEIIGKSVVATDGIVIGIVKDIAVSFDGKVALQVEPKEGTSEAIASVGEAPKELFVGSEDIQAVGDVVLLRYPSKRASPAPGTGAQMSSTIASSSASSAPPPAYPELTPHSMSRICPKCNYSNTSTSKFCIKCGTPLPA
jgi:sporulation protein YlmC with PRC-barrel domain